MEANEAPLMHISVLLKEVLDAFRPRSGEIYIDATINGGGHARAILERIGSTGKMIGIDRDCELINALDIKNIDLTCDSFANIQQIAKGSDILQKVNGVLFDLGFSSYHVDQSGRGFSFQKNESLDMRYDQGLDLRTATELLYQLPESELAHIFDEYGDEQFARRIARAIVRTRKERKIETTLQLVEIVKYAVPVWYRRKKIHYATKVFQALRIAVNDELAQIHAGLEGAVQVCATGGRIVVISFHSMEDRIVKTFFRQSAAEGLLEIITAKPIRPSEEEITHNPRARSARMRIAKVL